MLTQEVGPHSSGSTVIHRQVISELCGLEPYQ